MAGLREQLKKASTQKVEDTFDSTQMAGNFRHNDTVEFVFPDRYQHFRSNVFFITWVVIISLGLYGFFLPDRPQGLGSATVDQIGDAPTMVAEQPRVDTTKEVDSQRAGGESVPTAEKSAPVEAYDFSDPLIKQAVEDGFSEELPIGARLFPRDANQMKDLDYTVTYDDSLTESVVWLWDYAGADGDVVSVRVNGIEIGQYRLGHEPISLTIPLAEVETLVEVAGITDGGGGITYAIYFDFDGASYFNRVQKGSNNHYTFIRE